MLIKLGGRKDKDISQHLTKFQTVSITGTDFIRYFRFLLGQTVYTIFNQ